MPTALTPASAAPTAPMRSVVEGIVNDLAAVGIRARVRPMERAAYLTAHKEKTVKNLTRQGSGAFGNAATRIEAYMYSRGPSRFCVTPILTPGTSSRSPSATRRSARRCCIRSSRKRTTRRSLCRSGRTPSCVPRGHGWRCQG